MEVLLERSVSVEKKDQKYIYETLTGINKAENQDNLLVIEEMDYSLFAIFDGVGSAINSKQATIYAIDFLKNNYSFYIKENVRIDKLMHACNKFILSKKLLETYCTYCLAYISKNITDRLIFSSMGDSRIYQITNQYMEQLTTDDKIDG